MTALAVGLGRLLALGGWAPLVVLAAHLVFTLGFDLYALWPNADVPMHVAGGLSIAFLVSRLLRALCTGSGAIGTLAVLEIVLVGSLTVTAAVVWEFTEFAIDAVAGTDLQVDLADTMQDIALGALGAAAFLAGRARHLRAGAAAMPDAARHRASRRAT